MRFSYVDQYAYDQYFEHRLAQLAKERERNRNYRLKSKSQRANQPSETELYRQHLIGILDNSSDRTGNPYVTGVMDYAGTTNLKDVTISDLESYAQLNHLM